MKCSIYLLQSAYLIGTKKLAVRGDDQLEYYEYLGGDFVNNLFFGYYLGGVIEK